MPRITPEERITFYRMVLEQAGWTRDEDTFHRVVDFLHDNPVIKQTFMRYTRVTGKTNRFFSRIWRLIYACHPIN
jgi:hypothetical protein